MSATMIINRVKTLRAMHNVALALNNEDGYYSWIELGVPDEPTTQDFVSIAEDDDSWEEVTSWFYKVIKNYGSDGFYVG